MNKMITSIFLGATLVSLTYGILLCLPLFVHHLGGTPADTGLVFGASGVGTLTAILICKRLFAVYSSKTLLLAASLLYAMGMLGFSISHHANYLLYLAAILTGAGWGLYYNAAPFILIKLIPAEKRSPYFSYLAAFNVLGSGLSPVAIKFIWQKNIPYTFVFVLGAILCLLATYCFQKIDSKKIPITTPERTNAPTTSFNLFSSLSILPIVMVFLGACAFSLMTNFQTIFAQAVHLNYAYFFLCYSLTVVIGRFTLSGTLSKYNQAKVASILLMIMMLGLILFLFVTNNMPVYLLATILFGIGYGLVYPTIKAIAINVTAKQHHGDVISYFSLSYFIGVFVFPVLAGYLITHYGYFTTIGVAALLSCIELIFAIILLNSNRRLAT